MLFRHQKLAGNHLKVRLVLLTDGKHLQIQQQRSLAGLHLQILPMANWLIAVPLQVHW